MSAAAAVRIIVLAWVVQVGLVVYGHVRRGEGAFPPAYGFTAIAMSSSLLAALAQIPGAGPFAATLSVAYTARLFYQVSGSYVAAGPATSPQEATA